MTQKYTNIFFGTTEELNEQIDLLLADGAIIDSIIPIQSTVYHTSNPNSLDIDKICCQEVFVLYHKQK